jgi:hypothetical protein
MLTSVLDFVGCVAAGSRPIMEVPANGNAGSENKEESS